MAITPPRALHADGPDCFYRPLPIGSAGTVTPSNTSLTFTALDGQVVTSTENSANATFTGTDSSNVGRAASDRGRVTDLNSPYIASQLNGTFTSSAEGTLNLAGEHRSARSASCEASFEITGTVTFDTPCDPAQTSPH
jgi:hypothetical protein